MCMPDPDDPGETETRCGERRMRLIDDDFKVWYGKADAAADPDHEEVTERWE